MINLAAFRRHTERSRERQVQKAKNLIDNPNALEKTKLAFHGKSNVYLPKEIPRLVIKEVQFKSRAVQMHEVRSFCKKQGFSHLVVPRCSLYNGHLIETRLPINDDDVAQVMLYARNQEKCTPAIEELTALCCHGWLNDLMDAGHALCYLVGDKPRYDNLPFFVSPVDGQLKLGLIDLEHFVFDLVPPSSADLLKRLQVLVRIFPYHRDQILQKAKEFCPDIEPGENFERAQQRGLKFIEMLEGHQKFTQFPPVFSLSEERVGEIAGCIEKALREKIETEKENQHAHFTKFDGKGNKLESS